jgi:hypothetical protein
MEEDTTIVLIPLALRDVHLIEYALVVYLALIEHNQSSHDPVLLCTISTLGERLGAISSEEEQLVSLTSAEFILLLLL